MEMLERCPGCSVARAVEREKAETGPTFVSSSRRSRPCENCGFDGPFPPPEPDSASHDSLPSFAGARAKLATATQDLFRLSGSHSLPSPPSNSIPVEASKSAPPAPPASENPASSARKPEASIMFSLEALMKANQAPSKPASARDEAPDPLWNMHAAEPLFGTAADEALLTTPLKMEPAQSMDSMTLPSEAPNARRWWPIVVAATSGLVLAAGGIWVFNSTGAAVSGATPASEQAKIEAQPAVEPPAVLPEPAAPAEAEAGLAEGTDPSQPAADRAGEPSEPAADAVASVAGTDAPPASEAAGEAAASAPVASAEGSKANDKDAPSSTRKPPPRATPRRAVAPVMSKTIVPFDKNAARSALNEAASKSASCGAGGAPGKGKIQVTFGVNGKVSDAQLVDGPFAGTTAGKCALKHFRAAKVPPFAGSPVTVAKSFKID